MNQRSPLEDARTVRGAPDDERTVPGRGTAAPEAPLADHPLPFGTMIEGFRITGLIGEGGFGVVYRAWDDALERHVAIKEYMPASLARRGRSSFEVSVRSERHREPFEAGRKSFVNEARLLARFDHPALVKVFRFWEGNRTAYMAMPYYEGPTLKDALEVIGTPSEETLRGWLAPLLDALSVLHRQNCYHRDVAPDNILLTPSGPLLLDFGAARHVITGMTQALTVVLKPGFAPIEQYGGMEQGPWTDLYALAAVIRYAITLRPPVAAVGRVLDDTMVPLAQSHAGRYSDGFLRAIDAALAVRPEQRPQSVAQMRELLNTGLPADSPTLFRPSGLAHADFQHSGFSNSGFDHLPSTGRVPLPLALPVSGTPTVRIGDVDAANSAQAPLDTIADPLPARPVPGLGSRLGWALVALLLLMAGGVLWWRSGGKTAAPVAVPSVAPTGVATSKAVVPAFAPAPSPSAELPAAKEVAPAAAPVQSPSAATPAPAAKTTVAPAPALSPMPPATQAVAPAVPASVAPPRVEPLEDRGTAPAREPEAAPAAAHTGRPAPQGAERARPVVVGRTAMETRRVVEPLAESPPTPKEGRRPERCSDIVRKASLEALDNEEASYLRRECR